MVRKEKKKRRFIWKNLKVAARILPPFIAVILVLTISAMHPQGELPRRYLEWYNEAIKAEDYDKAYLIGQRLVQTRPSDVDYRYYLAVAAEKAGKEPQAVNIMSDLARSANHPPAVLWLAQRILDQPDLSRERLLELRSILSRMVTQHPEQVEARWLLGRVHWDLGDQEQSKKHFELVASAYPEVNHRLMHTFAQQGEPSKAKQAAEIARNHFAHVVKQKPTDLKARMAFAESTVFLGEFQTTEQTLKQGENLHPQAGFSQRLINLYRLWLQLLSAKGEMGTEEHRRISRECLALIEKEEKPDESLILLKAQIYASLGDRIRAEKILRDAADEHWRLLHQLAGYYHRWEVADQLTPTAQEFLQKAESHLDETGEDDLGLRVQAAQTAIWIRDYPRAIALLKPDWERTRDPRFANQLAMIYLEWWGDRQIPPPEGRVYQDLLREAFSLAPDSTLLLWGIVRQKNKFQNVIPEAVEFAQEMLREGKASAPLHLLLGEVAIDEGNVTVALTHMNQAHQMAPNSPEVLNGLAWVLSQRKSGTPPPTTDNLRRALELVNEAIRLQGKQPYLLDTRGRIFVQLARYDEALSDLEAVKPVYGKDPEFVELLQKVYKELDLLPKDGEEVPKS